MGFIDALLDRRAIDASQFPISGRTWSSVSDSGVTVNTDTAMRLVSVWACVTLIADSIWSMPIDVYRKVGDDRERVDSPPWVTRPNPHQTWGQLVDFMLHSLLTTGNAFNAVVRDGSARPLELMPIHPTDVTVQRMSGKKQLTVNGFDAIEYTSTNPAGDILHVLGHTSDGLVGMSPVDTAKQAIGAGLAIEEFGNKYFANGAVSSGVVEMATGSNPTPDQLKTLKDEFQRKASGLKNAWKPLVLANGATFKPITVSNDQAQFIESAKFSVAQIASLYRVPPHLIGDVERSTSWGTGIEQQSIGFVQHTLMPWIRRLEEAFNQLLPAGQYLKFNVSSLLRGDVGSRFTAYQVGIQNGFTTRNEVRKWEDLPPIEGGDVTLVPMNLTTAPTEGGGQVSARELTEMIQKIYLGVGKVLTADEAREILNREGAELPSGFEPFPIPAQEQQ